MGPYQVMRDRLRRGAEIFEYLDAAQLVKHAFGLVTDGNRKGKEPVLLYLYAEPADLGGRPINPTVFDQHRDEIARFAQRVAGAAVSFHSISYRQWIGGWPSTDKGVTDHGLAILARFSP